MTPTENLLAHMDGVRRSGRGYLAKCPAHEDRSASLSISEGGGGRALLRCFAGCDALQVVQSVGLTLADLFPVRLKPATPEEHRAAQRAARESNWSAALGVLSRESSVVQAAAAMMRAGNTPSADDADRLALAAQRIDLAREVLR